MEITIKINDGQPVAVADASHLKCNEINALLMAKKEALEKENEQLHADLKQQKLASATAYGRGWVLPKRGDKVRCVKLPVQNYDLTTEEAKLIVGNEYTVECNTGAAGRTARGENWKEACIAAIIVTIHHGVLQTDLTVPLDCFEPA